MKRSTAPARRGACAGERPVRRRATLPGCRRSSTHCCRDGYAQEIPETSPPATPDTSPGAVFPPSAGARQDPSRRPDTHRVTGPCAGKPPVPYRHGRSGEHAQSTFVNCKIQQLRSRITDNSRARSPPNSSDPRSYSTCRILHTARCYCDSTCLRSSALGYGGSAARTLASNSSAFITPVMHEATFGCEIANLIAAS